MLVELLKKKVCVKKHLHVCDVCSSVKMYTFNKLNSYVSCNKNIIFGTFLLIRAGCKHKKMSVLLKIEHYMVHPCNIFFISPNCHLMASSNWNQFCGTEPQSLGIGLHLP